MSKQESPYGSILTHGSSIVKVGADSKKNSRKNCCPQVCGYTVKKKGSEYYVNEVKGLTINPNTNAWYHHYLKKGGYTSIDCLKAVFDMDFKQAVYALTGQTLQNGHQSQTGWFKKKTEPAAAPPAKETIIVPKKEIIMPEKATADAPLFAYLHKTRGIPYDVIKEFKSTGLVYQSNAKFEGSFHRNAIFVHYDQNGNPAGGEIQGLDPVHRFKSMVPGTRDTVFRFIPEQAKSSRLKKAYIFESSIDLMSFYSMFRKEIDLKTSEFISLAGLKTSVPKRLQAEGIEIISCVDNDAAGQKFELQNGFKRSEFVREHLDASGLKDWNDLLRYPDAKPEQDHATSVKERFFGRSMTH